MLARDVFEESAGPDARQEDDDLDLAPEQRSSERSNRLGIAFETNFAQGGSGDRHAAVSLDERRHFCASPTLEGDDAAPVEGLLLHAAEFATLGFVTHSASESPLVQNTSDNDGPDPVIGAGIALLGIFTMGMGGSHDLHYVFDIGVLLAIAGAGVFVLFIALSAMKQRKAEQEQGREA